MVYALAAYSITIGVLALYGVLLQHRSRIAGSALAQSQAANGPALDGLDSAASGMNVGASLLAPFWMWAHGLRPAAAFVVVALIAAVPLYQREMWMPLLVVASVPIGAGAALAIVGNRIAAAHLGVNDAGTLSMSQFPWAIAGVLLHSVVLPWAAYFGGLLGA